MTIVARIVNLIRCAVTTEKVTTEKQNKKIEHKMQDTDDGEFEVIENLQDKIVDIKEGTGVIIVKKENIDKDY